MIRILLRSKALSHFRQPELSRLSECDLNAVFKGFLLKTTSLTISYHAICVGTYIALVSQKNYLGSKTNFMKVVQTKSIYY